MTLLFWEATGAKGVLACGEKTAQRNKWSFVVLPASGALWVFPQVELCGRFLLPYLPASHEAGYGLGASSRRHASHEAGYGRARLLVVPPLTRRATVSELRLREGPIRRGFRGRRGRARRR